MSIKKAEFYADFKFVEAGFKKLPLKNQASMKILKIRIVLACNFLA
jgi:hypothetical protein